MKRGKPAPHRLTATNVTTRATRVAGDAASVALIGNEDLSRAAFFRLCAHLRRRNGRIYFDRRGIAA